MTVDLIDHGEKLVRPLALSPMDFVNPYRPHLLQLTLRQSPLDKPFHRAIHRFPTGLKYLGRLPPAQPPCPARQEPHHGSRDWTLAFTPRYLFHHHPMLCAFHPPGRVAELGGNSPQRHKQPAPLRQSVVAGRRLLTLRAPPAHASMRLQADFDRARLSLATLQSNLLVNKPGKVLYSVQNRLNL